MIQHRNAYLNTVGRLLHEHMDCADRLFWTNIIHATVGRFLTVTAAGAGARLFGRKVDPALVFELRSRRSGSRCCAPRPLF